MSTPASGSTPARGPRGAGSVPYAATLAVFAVLAALLWINAGVNPYRFTVAIAVVGSVPLLIVAAASVAARRRRATSTRRAGPSPR